jgi:hypothetical protein
MLEAVRLRLLAGVRNDLQVVETAVIAPILALPGSIWQDAGQVQVKP